jgi:protein SCO1/2
MSRSHHNLVFCLALTLFATRLPVPAQQPSAELPPAVRDVGIDQRLGEPLPLDLVFVDETGKEVTLREYFGERPVILSLVYYECPMLCTLVLNGLVNGLKELPFSPCEDMELVTVSFDPGETPDLALAKKNSYVALYGHPQAAAGWHFLTGSEEAVAKLTEAVGFRYAYDEKTDQYAHASGIMLATPDGRLSHYFFGVEYPPRDLRLGLVEASSGKVGSPVDRLMLFCYRYDSVSGQYSFAAMNIIRLGCFLTILALAVFMFRMFRREARRRAQGERGDTERPTHSEAET